LNPSDEKIHIVACHYKLPEKRLRDFISWNTELFVKFNVTLHVVSDVPRDNLPEWVKIHIYPRELKVYSPARVSNFGIRQAGGGIVCKTDIDCVFSEEALKEISVVFPGMGVYFTYLMVKSYEERGKFQRWGSTCGTMALNFSDWEKLCGYDERLEGYGIEDGDGVARARLFCKVPKSIASVYHVSHGNTELWSQTNVCLRRDLWNRKGGFCPDRHVINRKIRDTQGRWNNPDWGKGIDLGPTLG